MIIANGTIECIIEQGGRLDTATGFPVAPSVKSHGSKIPCQFEAVSYNSVAQSNGETVTRASYTILIENFHCVSTERIRLRGRHGDTVGEFQIISKKPLDAVCQIKITV